MWLHKWATLPCIHPSLVNGTNGTFQNYAQIISKPITWIDFHNPLIGLNTITIYIYIYIYEKFPIIKKNWTPIEWKIIEIHIGGNHCHIIIIIQFPIQLAIMCIIHHAQGLTFDHLAFDSTRVTKHGLTYITLFKIYSKNHLHIFSPLSNKKFQINHIIQEEMSHLKTNTQYKWSIVSFKIYQTKKYLYHL
jgi:hypothetical protein